jgi:hypothetical protein
MWNTEFRENNRVWVHTFDNGYTVVTDLDNHENKVMKGDRIMSRQVISEDYTIDEHLKFLQMIDDEIDE